MTAIIAVQKSDLLIFVVLVGGRTIEVMVKGKGWAGATVVRDGMLPHFDRGDPSRARLN